MTDRIDAHHHFWKYDSVQYGWIGDEMAAIRRDFLPADLKREIDAAGVDGVVSVQARQTVEETEWLLGMAGRNPFIRGVVGWVPLASPQAGGDLERFAADPNLKAVRHVLHDEPDDNYMLRDDFNEGLSLLKEFGLAYDILIFER
ncbi:MAG: amidohydrolase family protein, partial [Phycisphaerae bacterium]|nr:amidohydrolase family protein [Phycisphaerae bacterium]